MKFIHLTDTHFVPKGKRLYGRDPRQTLEKAVADINANHGDAELVVITGDLTHWGEAEAFESLREALHPLRPPLKLLVGNHDDRALFSRSFPDQPTDANGFVQSTQNTAAGQFVFLDTMLDGTHAGHFCDARQRWLADALETSTDDLFLFMHHPPFLTGLPAADRIGLKDADAFRCVIEPFKHRIRHLFCGHVHRPIAGSWLGIPVTTLRALNHQLWFDMTEEDELRGSFEPPAYCVVLVDAERVVVHYHDFLDDSPKFIMSDSPWDDWSRRHKHP